MPSADYFR